MQPSGRVCGMGKRSGYIKTSFLYLEVFFFLHPLPSSLRITSTINDHFPRHQSSDTHYQNVSLVLNPFLLRTPTRAFLTILLSLLSGSLTQKADLRVLSFPFYSNCNTCSCANGQCNGCSCSSCGVSCRLNPYPLSSSPR